MHAKDPVVHVIIYFTVCKFYTHVKDPVVHVSIYFTVRKFCLTFHPFPFRSWIVAHQPRLGLLATDTHQNHIQQGFTSLTACFMHKTAPKTQIAQAEKQL